MRTDSHIVHRNKWDFSTSTITEHDNHHTLSTLDSHDFTVNNEDDHDDFCNKLKAELE